MNTQLIEIKDQNSNVIIAIIWGTANPADLNQMNQANISLDNFVLSYVGNRSHNIFKHTSPDTVAVVVTFDLNQVNKIQGSFFESNFII